MPTVQIGVRLPEELYKWLKDKAEKEHRTLSNTLIDVLIDWKDSQQENQKTKSSVKQRDIADIMNRVNDALDETKYEAVGYDNTGCWLNVIIDRK